MGFVSVGAVSPSRSALSAPVGLPADTRWRRLSVGDLLPPARYERLRDHLRPEFMQHKRQRQVLVGGYLNLLFESFETVQYQVQEVIRAEALRCPERIALEVAKYGSIASRPGTLCATLLLELCGDTAVERALGSLARPWEAVYVQLDDGARVHAASDDEGPSLVSFIRFEIGARTPTAVGICHASLTAETPLSIQQSELLRRDVD